MEILMIPVSKIKPDPNQPRTRLNEEKIKGMAQNLKNSDVGIINPIELDKDYMIVTGEHRWRAAKLAEMETVPCKIIEPKDRFFRQVVENIHQGVMSDWDVACALRKLLKGLTAERSSHPADKGMRELARRLGISRAFVQEKLAIFKESKGIQKAVTEGRLSARVIRTSKRAHEHKEEIREKFLKGELPTIDSVEEIAAAIVRAPEKARELLDKDYSKMTTGDVIESVRKISPTKSDLIRPTLDRVRNDGKSICDAVTELQRSLKEWPLDLCSELNRPIIMLALGGCFASIKKYLVEIKQLR